jgi:hypothetical protein
MIKTRIFAVILGREDCARVDKIGTMLACVSQGAGARVLSRLLAGAHPGVGAGLPNAGVVQHLAPFTAGTARTAAHSLAAQRHDALAIVQAQLFCSRQAARVWLPRLAPLGGKKVSAASDGEVWSRQQSRLVEVTFKEVVRKVQISHAHQVAQLVRDCSRKEVVMEGQVHQRVHESQLGRDARFQIVA